MRAMLMRVFGPALGYLACVALRLTGLRAGVGLMYHRVGDPPGDPAAELVPNLSLRLFEAQVRFVQRTFRIVQACELHAAALSRRRGQRFPVAITFDDDDPAHATVSAPALAQRGVTATFFLNGASLSAPSRFWWEVVQLAFDRGLASEPLLASVATGVARDDIHELGLAVQALPPAERDSLVGRLEEVVGPPREDSGLRAAQVRELADRGFEIGFHTRRHEYLASLDDAAVAEAMRDGRDELEEAAGGPLVTIAYPHGGGQEREAAAAHAAGFEGGFTTRAIAVGPRSDPLLQGRVEAPFDSTGRLALRIARALMRELAYESGWRKPRAVMNASSSRPTVSSEQ